MVETFSVINFLQNEALNENKKLNLLNIQFNPGFKFFRMERIMKLKELLINDEPTGTFFDENGRIYGNFKTLLDEDKPTKEE